MMKSISVFCIVLLCFLSLSCVQGNVKLKRLGSKTKGIIYITKSKVGFNIYSNKGELILEYTKRNCDSLSLKTLDDIYETAVEFYNRELFEEDIDKTQIRNIIYVRK